ncbi:hypothetical protein ES708_18131 [subsurface metagenome]
MLSCYALSCFSRSQDDAANASQGRNRLSSLIPLAKQLALTSQEMDPHRQVSAFNIGVYPVAHCVSPTTLMDQTSNRILATGIFK